MKSNQLKSPFSQWMDRFSGGFWPVIILTLIFTAMAMIVKALIS